MEAMKSVYKNSLGEEVKIKTQEGYCIIHMEDERKDTAEICILAEQAVGMAEQIIGHCAVAVAADPEATRKTNSRLMRLFGLIEVYNFTGVLRDEFEAFASCSEEPIDTIEGLIAAMEEEMSYWETESAEEK